MSEKKSLRGKYKNLTIGQKKHQVRVALRLLLVMVLITGIVVYKDYMERPGIVESSSLKAVARTTDSIRLEWNTARNTEIYNVWYKKKGKDAWILNYTSASHKIIFESWGKKRP